MLCQRLHAAQQQALVEHCPETTFIDASGLVEAGRVIKSEAELERMRRAARTTEAGLRVGIEALAEGVSEDEVAAEMHYAMTKAGGHWLAISPFVAPGGVARSATPPGRGGDFARVTQSF